MTDKTDIDYSKYGIADINAIGKRPRGAWVIAESDKEWPHIPVGSLCVKTRDGAMNPICVETLKHPQCFDTIEDSFDSTYRYYFFRTVDADMQGDAARPDISFAAALSELDALSAERNRCIKILLDAGKFESRDTIAERMRG